MQEPLTFAEFLELVPRSWLAGAGVVLGLAVGSFLNVVVYRLPRDVGISRPRSFCPRCETMIPWYQNVPVLSYLYLGGRCSSCGAPISVRYPLVEGATGALFAAALWNWGASWTALSNIVFGCAMLVLALVDFDFQVLPNAITLPGIAVGFALSFLDPRLTWHESGLGVLLGGGLLYGVAWIYLTLRHREGMGMGDVKMMAMVGAFLGWKGALLTIFLGSLLGSVVGVAALRLRGGGWDTALPFGTFLAISAVLVDWGGAAILGWYWGLAGLS